MLIRIDPSSSEPLFAQLAAAVRGAAARGELRAGERLPGARELADSLGVNLHTVLRGYQQLRDEGLVELRRGRGAVLTEQATNGLAGLRQAVADVVTQARRLGMTDNDLIDLIRTEFR
ncbi:GntR family transcriptional regulator [Phytoactinopolyspora halotolerans]|uniref:GntR family transcriptional regulator n=1 Tax=Phytoactinopolyspora halotolerans TaxID=1981512 RepID=A0A6L9S2I4_9ACTN|nr:GntR family transcriptional regulator [Phytoactinopolyspora halotolerans]NED98751.1 GntR family transcriptional regulator [Phytoactinopolyspora halotolerans]